MTTAEILNTGVYALVLGFGAIGLLSGLRRGFSRQTVKIITVIAAFLISLAIFNRAYPYLISLFEEKTIYEIAQGIGLEFDDKISSYLKVIDGEDAIYIIAIPLTVVVIPVLFLLSVLLLIVIFSLPYTVVCGALGYTKRANGPIKRILGGVLGAVEGVFLAVLIIVPVAGAVDIANEAVTYAETSHPGFKNTEKISNMYHTNIDLVSKNPVLKKVDATLGFIYDGFTTIDVEGEEIHVVTAVDDMVELYVYYGELGGGEKFDYKNPTPNDREIIDDMINSFGHDKLMTVLVADVFKAIGRSTVSEAFVLGMDEPLKTLFTALLSTFETSDEETIESDLHTFSDVYFLMAEEGVYTSGDISIMFQSFLSLDENGSSMFSRLCAILEANPRYSHMSVTLSNIAMDMLLQSLAPPGEEGQDVVETLNEVKDTVNNVLAIDRESFADDAEGEAAYKDAVSTEVAGTLEDNGIALEPDQVDQIADYIIEQKEVNGKTEFTDADMKDLMAKYYDIYSKGQSGELPPGSPYPPTDETPGGTTDETPEDTTPEN